MTLVIMSLVAEVATLTLLLQSGDEAEGRLDMIATDQTGRGGGPRSPRGRSAPRTRKVAPSTSHTSVRSVAGRRH